MYKNLFCICVLQREMVWLSCEGKNDADKEKIRNISFYPTQGFPGYYFPFRRQNGYKSPVVAVHFKDIGKSRLNILSHSPMLAYGNRGIKVEKLRLQAT